MKKIGLFYGPSGGSTERVAKLVAIEYGVDNVDLIPIKEANVERFLSYDLLICGVATIGKDSWNQEVRSDDWSAILSSLKDGDLKGKSIASFGLGDHITYGTQFCDSLGVLVDSFSAVGATIVGKMVNLGYEFDESKALRGDHFVGLPIDEDFEDEKTLGRVQCWVEQLKEEL